MAMAEEDPVPPQQGPTLTDLEVARADAAMTQRLTVEWLMSTEEAPDFEVVLAELARVLAAMFRRQRADQWETELVAAGIGCVAVTSAPPEAIFLGELGRNNGYLADVTHPTFGEHPRLAPLVRFSRSAVTALPGCLLGQHTASVLEEIGYSDDRIAALREDGVILTA